MKAFLWSLCLHLVLVGLLTYHHFSPTDTIKVTAEPPILAYAYQPVKAKAAPVVATPVTIPAKMVAAKPAVKSVQKTPAKAAVKKAVVKKPPAKKPAVEAKPQAKTKPASANAKTAVVQPPPRKPFVPVRKPAMVKPMPVAAKPVAAPKPAEVAAAKPVEVVAKPLPQPAPKPTTFPEPKPIEVASTVSADINKVEQKATSNAVSASLEQRKSMANKTLQAARQGDTSGSASWKEKQKQLALEITATKSEQKPEVGRRVKTFADGSSLIDTNPGCWKIPPPESSKDSIWLHTSVPCKADTTVEQIDAILEKRRSYRRE